MHAGQSFRDTKICFSLTILHGDGSMTSVRPGMGTVTVEAVEAGLVTAAEADDCSTGGLIGTAEGVTRLTVRFTSGGTTIEGNAVATVRSSTFALTPDGGAAAVPFYLAVGYRTDSDLLSFEEGGDGGLFYLAQLHFQWIVNDVERPRDAELLQRWLDVSPADPSIATVERRGGNGGDMWRFVGRQAGSTWVASSPRSRAADRSRFHGLLAAAGRMTGADPVRRGQRAELPARRARADLRRARGHPSARSRWASRRCSPRWFAASCAITRGVLE